jgi:uncharacterized protein (DUF362 family)
MIISIDYDDTYTTHPSAWQCVIRVLKNAGHRVIMVSSRRNTIENRDEIKDNLPEDLCEVVLLVNHEPKRKAAKKAGWNVDIWIDDSPETIASKAEMLKHVG